MQKTKKIGIETQLLMVLGILCKSVNKELDARYSYYLNERNIPSKLAKDLNQETTCNR